MQRCKSCWRLLWRREWDDHDWDIWSSGSAGSGCDVTNFGRTEVTLLFAAAGMPADAVAELGLVDPGVEQVLIAPVVVVELTTENNGRRRRIELLADRRRWPSK